MTGQRVPLGRNWPERARRDPPECLQFAPVSHATNTGILGDGLRLVDQDIDDPRLAETVAGIVLRILGEAPVRFRQNSARRCCLYRAAEGTPPKREVTGPLGKVEILGRGQQALAFGVHPSGVPLEWTVSPAGQITFADLSAVTEAQVSELLTAVAPLLGAVPKPNGQDDGEHFAGEAQADLDRVAGALAQIPNDVAAADWEWWNRIGMALWAACGGSAEGLALWLGWSGQHPSYSEKETRARWRNYHRSPPDELGAGTVFHLAQEAVRERLDGWFDPGPAGTAKAEQPDPWARAAQPEPAPEPEPEQEAEVNEWPEPMALPAFRGLFGEAIAAIMPHTEADPHALLLQLLANFGNKIGRGPRYRVGAAQHATDLFVLLAGATSRARKGTAETEIRRLFATDASDPWVLRCVQAGLSTGEGLINAVRDERWGKNKKGEAELLDEGVTDKRLLAIESEFAAVLQVMKREGNTLSPVLRVAWDRGELQTLTRNAPLRATGALISVIAHITIDELRNGVDRIALSNGLLNRFLFAAVKRARLLPHGGNADQDQLHEIGERLSEAIRAAQLVDAVTMTPAAVELWSALYPELTTDHPGLFGSLIARAEAHAVRLALLYALADQAQAIEPAHLESALAVWRYSEASARVLFGSLVGDPVADPLLVFLRTAGNAGMTRTELYNALNRHVSGARIQIALGLLLKQGLARRSKSRAGRTGAFAETWFALKGRAL